MQQPKEMNDIDKGYKTTSLFSLFRARFSSFVDYIKERVMWRKLMHQKQNTRIHSFAHIVNPQNVYLGENSHINIHCYVCGGDSTKIYIGDNVLMGPNVNILGDDSQSKGDIVIGNDVWLGANSIIYAGVHIADGCVIGAGSVVYDNIDTPYSIVGGIPAKVLAYRK